MLNEPLDTQIFANLSLEYAQLVFNLARQLNLKDHVAGLLCGAK